MNSNGKWMAAVTAAVAMTTTMITAGTANAQEPTKDARDTTSSEGTSTLPAADRSVELTLGAGYAQGLGNVGAAQPSLSDVGQAGGAVQVGVCYRLIPQLALGVYGSGATFARGDQVDSSTNLYTATAGVQADWHFIPAASQFDPWVSLGTGWRGYWVSANQGTTALHGLELAKLQVGVDYRIDRSIAVSPVIGADMSTFLTESTLATSGYHNVQSPKVDTFVFAGLQGRFDVPVGPRRDKQVASR
jgi:outer membrane protein W